MSLKSSNIEIVNSADHDNFRISKENELLGCISCESMKNKKNLDCDFSDCLNTAICIDNGPVTCRENDFEQKVSIICDFCGKSFKYNSHFIIHYRGHTNDRPFFCSICNRKFTSNGALRKHLVVHSSERPFECDKCMSCFKDKTGLKIHLKMHSSDIGKKFRCSMCNKTFHHKGAFNTHLSVHSDLRPYVCDICNTSFKLKSHLQNHELMKHSKEKNVICGICNLAFKRKCDLLQHMRTHTGEKPHICTVCEKTFLTKTNLKRHSLTHSNEVNDQCIKCNRNFSASYIKKHIGKCSGPIVPNSEEGDSYKCTDCNKTFKKLLYLRKHSKIHLSVKLYTCNMCGKGFNYGFSLKKHINLHVDKTLGPIT